MAVPPKLSTPRGGEEYGFSAEYGSMGAATTSGSTTTEEGFPIESGRSNSGSSVDYGGGVGSVRAGGSGGAAAVAERRGSADSVVTDAEASSSHGGDGGGAAEDVEERGGKVKPGESPPPSRGQDFDGVLEAAEAALAAATAAAGGTPVRGGSGGAGGGSDALETLSLSHPHLFLGASSTDMGGVGIEQSSEAGSSPRSVKEESGSGGRARSRGQSLHDAPTSRQARPPASVPVLGQHGLEKVEGGVVSFSDEPEQDLLEGSAEGVHQDPAFVRALAEAAQAEAEIEAAEVAHIEAARQRVS